jgi:curli biogenesis system outer membrane secretion channel CsgG
MRKIQLEGGRSLRVGRVRLLPCPAARVGAFQILTVLPLLGGCITDAMLEAGNHAVNAIGTPRPAEFTDDYQGPLVRVAVSRFDVQAAKADQSIGVGLADLLRAALAETRRFAPLEPITEAEFAMLDGPTGAKVAPATLTVADQSFPKPDLLVIGTITEFEPDTSKTETRIASSAPFASMLGGGSLGFETSHLAVSLRLVEPKTMEIVAATVVEAKASAISSFDLPGGDLGVGLSGHAKTPMEKAIRQAIEQAVHFLIESTPEQYFRRGIPS